MIDFPTFIPKFDAILKRGLSEGLGIRGKQVCVEAAICEALGLPHGDDPQCVAEAVRSYKIALNDKSWSSPAARAAGLRDLGIAQLGSKGVVNDQEFIQRLVEKTIRVLLPMMFREAFPDKQWARDAADICEKEGTKEAALKAKDAAAAAASAAYAFDAAASAAAASAAAAYAAAAYAAAYAAAAAAAASRATKTDDKYLLLSASLALDVLRELKSPGCNWL